MSEEEEKKKSKFITLSPTKIEVTSFNGLGNRIRDGEEHA
jgi:CRISPR/Cas system endoribonuclease Cas6 (RAMP superfamily)